MKATLENLPSKAAATGRTAELDAQRVLRLAGNVLAMEAKAIEAARERIGPAFVEAVRLVLECRGRIAVTGMGKAGDVGKKIQATLASTATPSYCLHPVEALHGDLGMIQPDDVVLALTKSGETQELIVLLPTLRALGCRVILMTSRPDSHCASLADIVIDIGDVPEACPLRLAPSSSTTAMLALGDALALTVMELKNVQPEQYASFHPGGALGRSLMKVHEIMRSGADCPVVPVEGTLNDYYAAVKKAPRRAGAAAVVDAEGRLIGFFTHGDLFRLLPGGIDPAHTRMADVMTRSPKTAKDADLVAAALGAMQQYRIDELPVVNAQGRLVGLIDIQDLVARGFSAFDDQ